MWPRRSWACRDQAQAFRTGPTCQRARWHNLNLRLPSWQASPHSSRRLHRLAAAGPSARPATTSICDKARDQEWNTSARSWFPPLAKASRRVRVGVRPGADGARRRHAPHSGHRSAWTTRGWPRRRRRGLCTACRRSAEGRGHLTRRRAPHPHGSWPLHVRQPVAAPGGRAGCSEATVRLHRHACASC